MVFRPILRTLPSPLRASGLEAGRALSASRLAPPGSWSLPLLSGLTTVALSNSFPLMTVVGVDCPPRSRPPWMRMKSRSEQPCPQVLLSKLQLCPRSTDPPSPDPCCAFGPLSDLFPRPMIFLYSALTSPEIKVRALPRKSFFSPTDLLSLPGGHPGGQSPGAQGTGVAVTAVVIIIARRRGEWQV